MLASKSNKSNGFGSLDVSSQRPEIDSHFRLIIVAALRSKQLLRGAVARIEPDPLRRRNTSIALEEVRRGLVHFTVNAGDLQIDPDALKQPGS